MSDILQRLKDAYQRNPAEAYNLLPELCDVIGKTVVELPCEVGDTLYWIFDGQIQECEFYGIQIYKGIPRKGPLMYLNLKKPIENSLVIFNRNTGEFKGGGKSYETLEQTPLSGFGKTVFLTRSQAEEALNHVQKEL